jgi:RNA polymerase sigma-70 factor (ECF subfamily)
MQTSPTEAPEASQADGACADFDLARRAAAGEGDAFRAIISRHNRRLYRIARSILRNDSEAEDVVQESYLRAFARLDSFRGESSLSTWIGRIVMNEALGRLRRSRFAADAATLDPQRREAEIIKFPVDADSGDPERAMAQREILQLVERAIDDLPDIFRTVLMMRVVEGMSVEETAELLHVKPETVKTRLHRARGLLRERLDKEIGPALLEAFPFAGRRCARVAAAVMKQLGFPD